MNEIIKKIINSGDLLWEELYLISLGEELGIRRALGTAAGEIVDIYKKGESEGIKKAYTGMIPIAEKALKESFDAGSSYVGGGPREVPTKKITVTDPSRIDPVPAPSAELFETMLNSGGNVDININAVVAEKTKIVEVESAPAPASTKELVFNNNDEIDNEIEILIDGVNFKLLDKEGLEKNKSEIEKAINAINKYLEKQDISNEDIYFAKQSRDNVLKKRLNEINDRIKKLTKKESSKKFLKRHKSAKKSGNKRKLDRQISLPITSTDSNKPDEARGLLKDVIQMSEARRASSTPEPKKEAILEAIKRHESDEMSPLTPGEQIKVNQIDKNIKKDDKNIKKDDKNEKDNKNIPKKPSAARELFPAKKKYTAYIYDSTSPNPIKTISFDEASELNTELRKVSGEEDNRYIKSEDLNTDHIKKLLKTPKKSLQQDGHSFYFSKAYYFTTKKGERSKNPKIDDLDIRGTIKILENN